MKEFTIENDYLRITLIDYGARIKEIYSKKHERNIVLNYESNEKYLEDKNFYGATIGPNANRIKNAEFVIDGEKMIWEKNDGNSNLHSGKYGFDRKYWTEEIINNDLIVLSLYKADPFLSDVKAQFRLNSNKVEIKYISNSDKKSIMNITNHTYFNLSDDDTVDNHKFTIYSSKYTPFDEEKIPIGSIDSVNQTEFDLRKGSYLSDMMNKFKNSPIGTYGYDINYISDSKDKDIIKLARVSHENIVLNIYSDQEAFQFYTGSNIIESEVRKARKGFCIEPQFIPNSVNSRKDKIVKDRKELFELNIVYEVV
ncbi:MAG: hypothetical protein SOU08_05400 [Anaerococcus sp.]|nr:hypothetical protein [Anaerococcus sp.]MDD7044008.1 hypothetical protein [Peptoniphilaceae bacterium]MDY2919056.1 hypothetical protein [Anaerococcus sp.]